MTTVVKVIGKNVYKIFGTAIGTVAETLVMEELTNYPQKLQKLYLATVLPFIVRKDMKIFGLPGITKKVNVLQSHSNKLKMFIPMDFIHSVSLKIKV